MRQCRLRSYPARLHAFVGNSPWCWALFGFSTIGLLAAIGVAGFLQRQPGGKLFAFAWVVLAGRFLILGLRRTGLLPFNHFTPFYGSAVEQFVFALAITVRLRAMHTQRLRDKVNAEQAVLRQQIAEQQSMEKSRMLRTLAHDVRQPLYSIQLVLGGAASVRHAKLQVKKRAHEVQKAITAIETDEALGSPAGASRVECLA